MTLRAMEKQGKHPELLFCGTEKMGGTGKSGISDVADRGPNIPVCPVKITDLKAVALKTYVNRTCVNWVIQKTFQV